MQLIQSKLERRYPREVKNFKMDTLIDDDGKLTILYQVVQGVADRSFGLCIAKLVGIDENVIQVILK
jgi:DNA mismatch repair ATPase MutS